jgi:hypothetical protein
MQHIWYPVQAVSKCVSYVRVTFKVNLKLMPAGTINRIIQKAHSGHDCELAFECG